MTLILDLHDLSEDSDDIVPKIKRGTTEKVMTVHLFSASNPGLNHVVALQIPSFHLTVDST
jgi:hypothetical protein